MAIVFEEITGEIQPTPRGAEPADAAPSSSHAGQALDADALRHILAHQQRLMARLSAD